MIKLFLFVFLSLPLFSLDYSKESFYKFGKSETTFNRLTVLATGDVLIYESNYTYFKNGGDKYDFYEMFKPCEDSIKSADYAIVNMEVTPGGRQFGCTGYPRFNAPFSLADALNHVGFDFFATANNHSYDNGEKAIKTSTDYYKKNNYTWSGTSSIKEDHLKVVYFKKNGIKLAILSITDLSNEVISKDFLVNTSYKKGDKEKIKNVMKIASENSDALILVLHYGQEYIMFPDAYQKRMIKFFADCGAKIIFAGHSHTLQPSTFIKNKQGEDVYVVYSTGNFVSWMSGGQLEKQVGGLFTIDIVKESSEIFNKKSIRLENPKIDLLYTVNLKNEHKTIYLRDSKKYLPNLSYYYKYYINHMKSYYSNIEIK